MKAIIIQKPGKVRLGNIDPPKMKKGEVILRPKVGGICGTDVHIYQGDFLGTYPVVPCHEFSAEIVDTGSAVRNFTQGDMVAVDPNIRCGRCRFCRIGETNICECYDAVGVTRPGGFAEYVAVPSSNVHRVTAGQHIAAAFAEPIACVLYGLSKLHINQGSNVIIWGAGAIGLLHMQVCRRLKGATVTVVDLNMKRVEKALRLGADYGIVISENSSDELRTMIPQGWDHAIEATGSVHVLPQLFSHLRRGGEVLVFGVYPKDENLSISPFNIFLNDWNIYGSVTYRDEFHEAVELVSSETLDPESLVDRKITLAQVPEYLKRLAKGEKLGKIHVNL